MILSWNSFQSTGSFFHDKSITLGSLLGVSGIIGLSRRSTRRRAVETSKGKKNHKSKPWLFSLCSKLTSDSVNESNNTPSLGHFLEVERRASNNNINRRNHGGPIEYGTDNFSPAVPVSDPNRLFVDGLVAAGQPSSSHRADGGARSNRKLLESGNGFGTPLVSSCLCGQLVKWLTPHWNLYLVSSGFIVHNIKDSACKLFQERSVRLLVCNSLMEPKGSRFLIQLCLWS